MSELLLKRFVKNYQDTEDATVRTAYGKLSGIVGIVCNLLLFASKLVIGTLSGSVSITADAVNNLSDASSSIVTLIGFRMAARPADEEHPYGHARIEYFSGLIVAALILLIGFELAKSSFDKILHPQAVEFSVVLVVVLVLSILMKLWMSGFFVHLGKKIHSSVLTASGADSRNDVISTAAVLLSCIIGRITGLQIDGYMGLLVALFILYSGVMIAKETMDPLLGAAPDESLMEAISSDLMQDPMILGIHDLMIHDYGPGRQFASAHAEIDAKVDVLEAHELLDEMERSCWERRRVALTIHYDPIVTDDEVLNRMRLVTEQAVKEIDSRLSIHDFRMVCGAHRTNLIFDVVVPFDLKMSRTVLKAEIDRRVQGDEDMSYCTVIAFDDASFNKMGK